MSDVTRVRAPTNHGHMTATSVMPARLQTPMASAIALGVFRIVVSMLFMLHGTAKLFGWPSGPPAAVGAWPIWWAGVLEIVLGGLIALGIFTRPASFVASGMMAVA
jgi:putative oxidoreductase